MNTTTWDYDYPTTEYEVGDCQSVLDATIDGIHLSLNNAKRLCNDHGSTYKEFVEECGVTLNAKSILEWLGY